MPRAHRSRWSRYPSRSSGASPCTSTSSWYRDTHPRRCIFAVVWKSSAIVSVLTPPTDWSALLRISAAEPHQNTPLCRSLPGHTTSKNRLCS
ncbi:MAG: hypothetical protein M0Z33_08510 [Actinomycetota bacterium]|nr:hypothetical protein [Actinomycetota bacterium]